MAGLSAGESNFEALEQRQLLFALTISPDAVNPATGLGTVTATWGYVAPYLFKEIPDANQGMAPTVVEEFDDETDAWATNAPFSPPNGTIFNQSEIRLAFRSQAASPARLLYAMGMNPPPVPGVADGGANGANDKDLAITLSGDDQMTFSFLQGTQQGQNPSPRLTTNVRFTIRSGPGAIGQFTSDGDGLKTGTDGTRVELLRDGVVVQVISGAALAALGQVQDATTTAYTINFAAGFDSFRFAAANENNTAGWADAFILDDITTTFPPERFADFVESRIRGLTMVFTGPAGATIRFLDLYGNEMINTLALKKPQGAMLPRVDRNGDAIPDFNDGLGQIIITGSNGSTSLTMFGGTIMETDMGPVFELIDSVAGNFDDFETEVGFGYDLTPPPNQTVIGLPEGSGSLILGSPYVRNRLGTDAYLNSTGQVPPANNQFLRADQGIFVQGASMGSVLIHGIVHGSSVFEGSLGRYNAGLQLGSVSVAGDLGEFVVASDAGHWEGDDGDVSRNVGAQLTVGRTIREIAVGGRLSMSVQVLADINNPQRPPLSFLTYNEREVIYGIRTDAEEIATINATLAANGTRRQASLFGGNYFRNDSLTSAEYIGYNGTAVRLVGELGAQDPVSSAEDIADVFVFAADPSREVVIDGVLLLDYVRILDRNGLPVAAADLGAAGRGPAGNAGLSPVLRFRPDHADIFYLVLNSAPRDTPGVESTYDLLISGLAPTTVGAVRSGAAAANGLFTLNAGSVGSVRPGMGFLAGDATESSPNDIINSTLNDDDLLQWGASTISVPNNLYNITAGGDINGTTVLVGRDLGTMVTGISPVAGIGVLDGDLTSIELRTGRRIGILDIRGGLGIDQDSDPDARNRRVSIRSGTSGGNGDIGQILVGAYASTSDFSVITSPGSTIDQFLVNGDLQASADPDFVATPGQLWDGTPLFRTGIGSDVRFVDFGLIQNAFNSDVNLQLAYNQTLELVDDAGASFTIRISGGGTDAAQSRAEIRALPVDGSQGVAVGRIDVRLVDGANLFITATGTSTVGEAGAVISIGRLIVNVVDGATSPAPPASNRVVIADAPGVQAEIDIGRLEVVGGLAEVTNTTVGRNNRAGDIVAVDAQRLDRISVSGNLGRTETNGAGSSLLGPLLGIAADGGEMFRGPFGVSGQAMFTGGLGTIGADWDGTTIINPVLLDDYDPPAALEDVGSPVDFYLNGVIVRTGDLVDVRAAKAIGDVYLGNGHLLNLVANSDNVRAFGAFDGIVGSIYAEVINTIDIGDGLRGTGPGPFAQAGIFANDEIITVNATRVRNAVIQGVIVAADLDDTARTQVGTTTPTNIPGAPIKGFGTLNVTSGQIDGLLLHSMALDDWWRSDRQRDESQFRGNITRVNLVNTTLFRSELSADLVNTVSITGGAYDSTTIVANENVVLVTADAYRNSTLLGAPGEFHANEIRSTRNLGSVVTTGLTGEMADLLIDVVGTVTGRIAAGNLVRLNVNVDNIVNELSATEDAKSVSVVSGRIRTFSVGRNIRATSLNIAGPVETITAGGEMTGLTIQSSGPDGRIGTIRANGRITADISSSGPINTIESVNSDIQGTIIATDTDGNIGTLRAGRDLLVDLRVPGSATTITAGRDIGRASDLNDRALDIRGNLGTLTAGGQIFSDILVGQDITGTIRNGRAISKPGNDQVGGGDIVAFGSIATLDLQGDFNGNITSYTGGIGSITITNGSFRQGKTITAMDGDIGTISIRGGNLLGNVITDGSIGRIELLTANGYTSDIGISNRKSNSVSVDGFRNQLPPDTNVTAGRDGPTISAGHDIGSIFLQNGTIWEALISAGRTIQDITVNNGGFRSDRLTNANSTFVIAGDRIERVSTGKQSFDVTFIAGIISLGADNAVGGIGENADIVKQASIGNITLRGRNNDVKVSAGLAAGADGVYNTGDDLRVVGDSTIDFVRVNRARTSSVWADGRIFGTAGGNGLDVKQNASGLEAEQPGLFTLQTSGAVRIPAGVVFNFTTPTNQRGTILFNGPGAAWWDASLNRVILLNTTLDSSLLVQGRKNGRDSIGANLRDFEILGNNNAALGSLTLNARPQGASTIFIDGGVNDFFIHRIRTTGTVGTGGDVNNLRFNRIDRIDLQAREVGVFRVNGFYGSVADLDDASAEFLDLGTLSVGRTFSGNVSSDHDIDRVQLNILNAGGIRSGGDIGLVTAERFRGGIISARDSIAEVNVSGEVRDSAIYVGTDLGRDASFGGEGLNADVVTNGVIGPVTVAGGFPESDIAAGVSRGADGFLGTADDRAADGRSVIGTVTIGDQVVGSTINSEQYRVISTGGVGTVTAGGAVVQATGNFAVRQLGALPVPVVVTDVNVFEDSRIYRAQFFFNQPIDASTFAQSLSVLEIRNGGATFIGLAQGTAADYTVRYDAATNIGTVTFSRNVTDRSLPQQPGVPGPGVYRLVLSGATFRGASQGVLLDGNMDGTTGDDFSMDVVVGDAGDKLVNGNPAGQPGIDFYAPVDLNLLLDSNFASDNNPDVNTTVIVRGVIGDHPDANSNVFRIGGDVDLYRVSLRAGQILKLGAMRGVAQGAFRAVFDASGNLLASNSPLGANFDIGDIGGLPNTGADGDIISLPAAFSEDLTATGEEQYLVTRTGTYIIGVSGTDPTGLDIADVNAIANANPAAGAIGAYQFTVQIFDDGNTGFVGDTDSGDGTAVVNAPLPIQFAGADGTFGTVDDIGIFATGRYSFTLDRGPDGRPNTADDVVSGSDGGEVVSTRRSGADGLWGTTDDVVRSVVTSAIGLRGGVGVPSEIASDADVYRLNNGNPIAPGTRVRFTFRLTDTGGNIGLPTSGGVDLTDFLGGGSSLGDVQIALFETPAGTGFSNAKLLASPSEFVPIGGQTAFTRGDGTNSYGYDASGDFFMEVVLPGSMDVTGVNVPASYAFYVQGSIRSDYTLEILTQGTGNVQRSRQNVLLETNGGTINWLETSGVITQIEAFTSSVLGFAGQISGIDVDEYIIGNLVDALNSIFEAANVDIVVSDDAADFEGQAFSTVFLAGNTEPNAFFNDNTFGASQHVDMLNIDKSDQAVVFVPGLATLGNEPSQLGVDLLVQSLTAAVGRRIGELIGLRVTNTETFGISPVPIMSSDSVFNVPGPGGVYEFSNTSSRLSGLFDSITDTNFFLGSQNSLQLLQRIIRPRV